MAALGHAAFSQKREQIAALVEIIPTISRFLEIEIAGARNKPLVFRYRMSLIFAGVERRATRWPGPDFGGWK